MSLMKKCLAELIGTFWLTFGGCGSAVLAAMFIAREGGTPINLGIGLVGVSLAFGLTVLTMAYTFGHISGCHLNPAVSAGLLAAGRMKVADFVPYVIAQVLGACLGAGILYVILSGTTATLIATNAGAFATNGYGELSPGKFSLASALITEVVLTFMFLLIILGSTDPKAPVGFAPIAIGLGLTLIHLIGIPVTNLSVNPARSTGPAAVVAALGSTGQAMQLWLFWAAPIGGAVIAGVLHRVFFATTEEAKA
jgi:aquaporin Z